MKRFVIERDLPSIGQFTRQQLKDAAENSNRALVQLTGRAQWVQSYVMDDKTYCIYLAEDEAAIREHARLSGFPANRISEVRVIIDPITAVP
jgi:Nickel responsive protein SCO4226-like